MDKKDKFIGIPFHCLPLAQQVRLANRLDQDDGAGKDYVVFAQTLEKMCSFKFGVADYNELKVLRSVARASPTLLLFERFYVNNHEITLDLVYKVFQEMGLEDCAGVLDESFDEIIQRRNSGPYQRNYGNFNRPYDEHSWQCTSCGEPDTTQSRNFSPADVHYCHHSNRNCQPSVPPNLNCPVSNTVHPSQSLHCSGSGAGTIAPLPVHRSPQISSPADVIQHHLPNTRSIRQHNLRSEEGPNLIPRGPAAHHQELSQHPQDVYRAQGSTSTVQIPFYVGSSLKTPVPQATTSPGAIPKQRREHPISSSDNSPLSPLEKQNRADNRQYPQRRNSSSQRYPSSKCQNEPRTLQNISLGYNRHPAHVNDLGKKDNVKQLRPVSNGQCTCPPKDRTQHSASSYQNGRNSSLNSDTQPDWFPPSDIDDDDSEQTKLLEVVGSSSSQCTCPSQNSVSSRRQSSNNADAERRYSNPQDSTSSSDNCSEMPLVRRSSSDEELKRNNLSPPGSIVPRGNRRPTKLFLTFADDSERHLNQVLELGAHLKNAGFSVKCDMFDQTIQRLINQPITAEVQNSMQQLFSNTYDWLDFQVQSADYIVFCLSPKYFQYVRPQEQMHDSGNVRPNSVRGAHAAAGTAHPNNCHLHTKYIYNQAFNEHFWSLTQNKRFYPVLFQESGATEHHVPSIFKSTLFFNYPDPNSTLLRFLSNRLIQ